MSRCNLSSYNGCFPFDPRIPQIRQVLRCTLIPLGFTDFRQKSVSTAAGLFFRQFKITCSRWCCYVVRCSASRKFLTYFIRQLQEHRSIPPRYLVSRFLLRRPCPSVSSNAGFSSLCSYARSSGLDGSGTSTKTKLNNREVFFCHGQVGTRCGDWSHAAKQGKNVEHNTHAVVAQLVQKGKRRCVVVVERSGLERVSRARLALVVEGTG